MMSVSTMLIQGGVSPRTTLRVDTPVQTPHRLCRPPPPDDLLTFEDEVVFEWSKSIPPEVAGSRRSKSRTDLRNKAGSGLQGLFPEVIEDLAPRPPSGSVSLTLTTSSLVSPTSYDRRGSIGEISSRTASRCESAQMGVGTPSPQRCDTAPPRFEFDMELDGGVSPTHVVDAVMEHEVRTRARCRSCRLYGEPAQRSHDIRHAKSARRIRTSKEERYLQTKYRDRPCSRAESFINENMFDSTSNLSRECCDVLGPRHCYDCCRLTQRDTFFRRNNSEFPSIHTTPKTMSTLTLVQRLFPELTTLDILEGVADGYISSRSFSKQRLLEICERKEEEARKKEIKEKWKGAAKRRISAFSVPDKQNFFRNFTDLRAQLLAQRGSYTGFKGELFPMPDLQQMAPTTEIELVLKKEEDRENPANYFCPPLMTREEIQRQRSQPRFYAGAKEEYKLPDAPPLTDILHKTNKAIREMESKSVIKPPAQGLGKPSPLVEGIPGHPPGKPKALCGLGGSGGMFVKQPGRSRPPRFGKPEIGGSFGRKSMPASSFSRPLQMETLTEDGSQSERSDVMEEEEDQDEEEEEKEEGGGDAAAIPQKQLYNSGRTSQVHHGMSSLRSQPLNDDNDLMEEEEEEDLDEEEERGEDMIIEEEGEDESGGVQHRSKANYAFMEDTVLEEDSDEESSKYSQSIPGSDDDN